MAIESGCPNRNQGQNENSGMIGKPDEAVYRSDSGEIEPLGNVRVKLITQ